MVELKRFVDEKADPGIRYDTHNGGNNAMIERANGSQRSTSLLNVHVFEHLPQVFVSEAAQNLYSISFFWLFSVENFKIKNIGLH